MSILLPRLRDDPFILSAFDIVQRSVKMSFGILQTRGVALCVRRAEVRMY